MRRAEFALAVSEAFAALASFGLTCATHLLGDFLLGNPLDDFFLGYLLLGDFFLRRFLLDDFFLSLTH